MKTHRLKLLLPAVTLALSLISSCSFAATLVVTNLASLGPGTLRQALSDNITLGGGHTIVFSNVTGTIILQGELSVFAPVTILGPGTNVLAVSGNNFTRVFTVTAGPTFISDLTIRNGRAVGGPGQGNQEDGQDGLGGGIWNLNSMLTISNCLVLSNSVVGGVGAERRMGIVGRGGKSMGGGICNSGGTLSVLNTRFEGNESTGGIGGSGLSGAGGSGGEGHGGAIYSTTGTGQIVACTFINNQVSGGQGGFSGGGQHGAGSQGYGGAIYSISPLTILNSTLCGNAANGGMGGNGMGSGSSYGGGIYSISTLNLHSCTIVSNTALSLSTDFGGGIYGGGDTGITNCTIAFNQSDNGGGLQGAATLANTIVARNSATNGPDGNGFLFNSQDYNLIENTNGMTLLGTLTHV
ncbi:MAG TPA: hypothetical protein VFZ59_14935, partial [Verrucomicrobiae bacterium]|nr:hypothetical protein [Verrucomicrobiae bacterium]